jgi:hypothetical protein
VPLQPLKVTVTAGLTPTSESDVSIDGLLHWEVQEDCDVKTNAYIITVTPESEKLNQSIELTSNTSTKVTLLFDEDYIISVEARNCIGVSKSTKLFIQWGG